jgi:hypothetical protein|tara:strand:+ start:7 stop:2352 length:2346 start_codon:yes stop_codon:yes gene_type:complete
MVLSNSQWLANAGAVFEIDQSIRFNEDDSAHLDRTPSSESNRNTFTFSVWIKRGRLTSHGNILSAGSDSNDFTFLSFVNDKIVFADWNGSYNWQLVSTAVFRDPGAWYNIVAKYDDTQSTASNRVEIYVNGSKITDYDTESYPSQNYNNTEINSTDEHTIGKQTAGSGANDLFDGYMAEIVLVDGTALDASSFGETNSDTGQWVPKDVSGLTFGTNGFRLKGQDSSALGDDTSGNGNDFTSSGLAAADQMSDSPTNNQATLNPLFTGAALSDGNLVATASGNSYQRAFSTFAIDDGGKHVCEFQKSSGTFGLIGIMQNGNHTNTTGNSNMYGYNLGTGEVFKGNPTASVLTDLGTGAANSLMRIEYDGSNDTIKIFDDGTEIFPASTGVSNTVGLTGHNSLHFGCAPYASGTIITATFSPLSGTPTTGFKELTAPNLPDPTIADPSDHFNTVLYTGNGATGQSITGVGFQPDWTWTKIRSPNAYSHQLFDAVRGAGKNLQSNNTNAEGDLTSEFISFDSDGFSIDDVNQNVNENSSTYVSWNWKANGSGSSNEDGSINTTATSANTTAGFSISTFTGNGTSGATFGHGLGVAPKMVIVKERSPAGNNWKVGHDAMGWGKYIAWDTNAAQVTDSAHWNDTAPSSSVVTLGDDTGINQNTATYVAYCFAEVAGYSSIGGYEGNGSTNGPFIYTGFKPAWIMLKRYDSSAEWEVSDRVRDPDNPIRLILQPNSNAVEWDATTRDIDWLSNGFKHRSSHADFNASGGDYLYLAFAESPFKTATAR